MYFNTSTLTLSRNPRSALGREESGTSRLDLIDPNGQSSGVDSRAVPEAETWLHGWNSAKLVLRREVIGSAGGRSLLGGFCTLAFSR